jgi:starvation-inducible DNA-binding protein
MVNKVIQSVYELEYNKLEQAQVIKNLNILLASYQIFLHKLKIFHWNIVGQDYYNLRQKFMDLFNRALHNSDEIAERIRIFDQTPVSMLNDVVKLSQIDENEQNLAGFEMVKEILKDILILLTLKKDCLKSSIETEDSGTEAMIKILIYEMEKDHRSLLSWLK